jgi:hypothetical protein
MGPLWQEVPLSAAPLAAILTLGAVTDPVTS